MVLLREVDEFGARALAERIRAGIESARIDHGGQTIAMTVSSGVAGSHAEDGDINDTIERADRGLYMAKNTGRNRVFLMPWTAAIQSRSAA